MTDSVPIPTWLVVIASAALVLAMIWNIAFPVVRAYVRLRRRRLVDNINSHLPVHLPPLALMRRSTLIDQLAILPFQLVALQFQDRRQ